MRTIIACIALGIIATALYSFKSAKKIAYLDTGEVFKNFAMTKKMDEEVKAVEAAKKKMMDSLITQLKQVQSGVLKVSDNELEMMKAGYLEKRSQLASDLNKVRESAMEKIWKQINQYVSEYGKENHYDVILGANGQGSLMYASEGADMTKEILRYVNEKYEGAH